MFRRTATELELTYGNGGDSATFIPTDVSLAADAPEADSEGLAR